jgi:hypothetical protein
MPEFRTVRIQLVADEQTAVDETLRSKTVFLQAALQFELDDVIGDAAPDLNLEALGHMWQDVKPNDGVYQFEIATELPYYLPGLSGRPEYFLEVGGLQIFVCLRMLRVFFGEGYPSDRGTSYCLLHRSALRSYLDRHGRGGLHPVPIKTFLSCHFAAPGESAESVIRAHFCAWRDHLVTAIAKLLDAMRTASPDTAKHLLPHASSSAFPLFWVVAGSQGCSQFVGELGLAAFRSTSDISAERQPRLQELLRANDEPPAHEYAVSLARTFCHYGYFGFAIVQVCVACETVLAQQFRRFAAERGVSNNALKDNRKEITFSQLLNIHLFSMRSINELPEWQNIVQRINWARGHRNDVVHEGRLTSQVSATDVSTAIDAAEKLIVFLLK